MRAWPVILLVFALLPVASGTEYFVSTTGDDANPGTIDAPFRTVTKGVNALTWGDTLSIREGVYRLVDESTDGINLELAVGGTRQDGERLLIRGYPGEEVWLYGSVNTTGVVWTQENATHWRTPGEFLPKEPTGMHKGSHRIIHPNYMKDGARQHPPPETLVEDTWTLTYPNGTYCSSTPADCILWYYPPTGENPNAHTYELAQRGFFHTGGAHTTIQNLKFAYMQSAAFHARGEEMIIENNTFAHTSNHNGNAYSFKMDHAADALVRYNEFYDSYHWAGDSINSKLLTFMINDHTRPSIVEYNYLHSQPGGECITTKSGVANLIVRHNIMENCGVGVAPPGPRCEAFVTDCSPGNNGYHYGGNWTIYQNLFINSSAGLSLYQGPASKLGSRLFNNVFINTDYPVHRRSGTVSSSEYFNNIYVNAVNVVNVQAIGSDTDETIAGMVMHDNLYFNSPVALWYRYSWASSPLSKSFLEMQTEYSNENGTVSGDPLFVDDEYHISPSSPAKDLGDGSYWGVESVHAGAHPFQSFSGGPREDLNGDGVVDLFDILFLMGYYGAASPLADLNGDGKVNLFDLVRVAGRITSGASTDLPRGAWVYQDFEDYADIAALDADTAVWAWYEARDGYVVEIDQGTAYPGLTKSLRYDWLRDDPCVTMTNTRQLLLPSAEQELWIEFAARWSENFDTTPSPAVCAFNAGDHKTFFATTQQPNTGRWELKVGAQGSVVMRAAGTNTAENDERYLPSSAISPAELWDGGWHVIRLYFRHSSNNISSDGAMRLWVDGELMFEETGINTVTDDGSTDAIAGLRLGSTQQKGPAGELMSMWWGYVAAHRTDPGWI